MRYILVTLFIILLSGCITTTVPSKSEYRIKTDIVSSKNIANGCKNKSLKVAQAFSSATLVSKNISYAMGSSKQFIYSESLWAQSPNSVITSKFLPLIRNTNFFKSVQVSKSRSRNDIILEITVEDFMQYFNESSTTSYANVAINIALIDVKSIRVFANKTFSSKVYVQSLNAQGGVEGLSHALSNVLNDTNIWIAGVCK
jgi:cholesterol transport system auxiliary component